MRRATLDQQLTPTAKIRLAAEILFSYARIRWLLRSSDLPVTVERVRGDSKDLYRDGADDEAAALRLARAVARTMKPVPTDSRCLMRSLVLTALLSARGIPSTLVIGTRTLPDFAAHAWVEVGGHPVLPDGSGEYGRLLEI